MHVTLEWRLGGGMCTCAELCCRECCRRQPVSGSVLNIPRTLLHFPPGVSLERGGPAFPRGEVGSCCGSLVLALGSVFLASLGAWEWACAQALGEFACGTRWESVQGWVVALPLLLNPVGGLLNLCSLICEMGILEIISDKIQRI